MVRAAPAGLGRVRHGDKVHVLHGQPAEDGGLSEPEQVLHAQVRLHVLLEDLGKLIDLAHVLHLKELLDHGFQKRLLGLDPAQIAVRVAVLHVVVMAVADHAHSLLAAQELIALLDVDGQVLIGVVVIHVPWHVEIHAADGVHQLAHGLPLDNDLIIRLKAHQLGYLLIDLADALFPAAVVIIDGVDALDVPRHVHHGVPGDVHDGQLLVRHIIACQHHGVRIPAAAGIPAHHEDRVVILALALPVAPGTDAAAVVDLLRAGFVFPLAPGGKLRLDEQAAVCQRCNKDHRQHRRHGDEDLLSPGEPALARRLLLQAAPVPARCLFIFVHRLSFSSLSDTRSPPAWRCGPGCPAPSFPPPSSQDPSEVPCPDPRSTPPAVRPHRGSSGSARCSPPDK